MLCASIVYNTSVPTEVGNQIISWLINRTENNIYVMLWNLINLGFTRRQLKLSVIK